MQKAQTLKEEKGILKLPDLVVSKKIDQGTIELVKAIYSDDEYAHQLPGKKDCVSIGMKWYMQKTSYPMQFERAICYFYGEVSSTKDWVFHVCQSGAYL